VVERQDDDARAEPKALRLERQRRQRQGRRGAVAVLAEVMLGRPHRVESVVLGRAHQRELLVDDLVLGLPDRVLEQVEHPEVHVRILPGSSALSIGLPSLTP
jgi:hypothetical protein